MGLVVNSLDYWLAGDVFLRNYYIIMDMDNSKIGMTPHATSYAGAIKAGGVPSKAFYGSYDATWYTYGGVIISILGIVVIPLTCLGGCLVALYYCFVSPYKAAAQ